MNVQGRGWWPWRVGAALAVALWLATALAGGSTESPAEHPPLATAPWVVVAIGDSTPAGYGHDPSLAYPAVYGALLADALGVEVVVANHASGYTRTVAHWADRVRTDGALAHDLASARVVLVWLGWHDILPIVHRRTQANWPDPMREQLVRKNFELVSAWSDLLVALRGVAGPDCVILVADSGLIDFLPEQFGREPYWPELKRLVYLDWRDALVQAAEAVGARVVPTMTALGGPDGEVDQHPEFASGDGLHLNEAGHRFLAELHRAHDGIGGDALGSDDR